MMQALTRVGTALLLLGLAACGDVVARATPTPTQPPPTPTAVAGASQATFEAPEEMSPAAATALVQARVTAMPRLLPAAVPAGLQAIVSAAPEEYRIEYTDDAHTRTITIDDGGGGFGINGPHQVARDLPFRGVTAAYYIFDTTVPTSRRSIYWKDATGTPEYSMVTVGFTEAEFWQIANSLRAV